MTFSFDFGVYSIAEEGKSKRSWVNLDDVSNNLVRDLEPVKGSGYKLKLRMQNSKLYWRKHVELVGELSNLQNKEEKLLSESIPNLCGSSATRHIHSASTRDRATDFQPSVGPYGLTI
ncbi:hypothetical protein QVD17_37987 [Tagetes erecta]|uniref:Uncharacterized protein n=1 Tax=Tagetes erecta TaxID=13708 RepID=A0AAD8NKI6_TARER|nr:hypothetical protein QVD17_37986 [Tagetes erecta]KAK1411438.1 hypothetical protein QVD17_37987 [Tagetes erecta]